MSLLRYTVIPINCPEHGNGISRVPVRTVDEAFFRYKARAEPTGVLELVGNDVGLVLSPLFGLCTEGRPACRLASQLAVSLHKVLERPWSVASLSTQHRLCPQLR